MGFSHFSHFNFPQIVFWACPYSSYQQVAFDYQRSVVVELSSHLVGGSWVVMHWSLFSHKSCNIFIFGLSTSNHWSALMHFLSDTPGKFEFNGQLYVNFYAMVIFEI